VGSPAWTLRRATGCSGSNGLSHRMVGNLSRYATAPTDQELMRVFMRVIVIVIMRVAFQGFRAAHEGVQPFQAMDQPLFQQKIERAINRGRCSLCPAALQLIQQRISADRGFCFQHQAQHITAQRRQLHAPLLAKRLSPFERGQMMSRTMHDAS
jgi:hypothetical protein